MNWEQATEELRKPLDRAHVKQRPQGGSNVSYIEGWHVIDEANRIFGFDGWHRETVVLEQTNRDLVDVERQNRNGETIKYQQWRIGYIAKVRVTVDGVVREGTGYGSGTGRPDAIGEAVEGAIKEAETDAMKRALMTFGNPFGLALYDKDQTNVAKSAPAKKAPPAKKDDDPFADSDHEQTAAEIIATIGKQTTLTELSDYWHGIQPTIKTLPDDVKARVTKEKDRQKAAVGDKYQTGEAA